MVRRLVASDGGRVLLPAVVLLTFLGATLAGFMMSREAVHHEERILLQQRASEVAAILSTSDTLALSLRLVGESYAANPSGEAFDATASALVNGGVTTIGIAEIVDPDVVVRAAHGIGPVPGDSLAAERAGLIRAAAQTDGLTSALIDGDEFATLVVGLARPDGLVVFQESLFPRQPIVVPEDSPFASLDAVLYRTPAAEPANVIITTTDEMPLDGHVESRQLDFGSEQWLLETAAHAPLNSRLTRLFPWIILVAGSAAATLASGIVAVLTRRRAYALDMVEQRTVELRRAMNQLEAARAEADDANKAKSKFLSRMSHELRTPLNAVLGFAQLLHRDDRPADERDAIEHILKGGNHLLSLINEVLDITRIESGKLAMSTEPVLADDLIAETLDLMRPLAAARSITMVATRQPAASHYVFADRQRLKQILLNLVSNAIKYNRVGGSVHVSCEQVAPTRLRLNVTDTGPGIKPDQLALLFVPFERLGADRTDVEGSGIGLALSRRLAETMGGRLDVASQPGVGSTFSVELPLVEGAVERFERLSHTAPVWPPTSLNGERATVLYIEDNVANVTLLQRVFEDRRDIEIMSAMQGRLGIELARQHRPDVILLDLHLPDMAGDEIVQLLRNDPLTREIPVIVVSADATPGQIQRLKSVGAFAYLTKPFDIRQLHDTVTSTIADRTVLRQPAPSR